MSELNVDAPLAITEEWSEICDSQSDADGKVKKKDKQSVNGDHGIAQGIVAPAFNNSSNLDFANLDINFNDSFSDSLEDLVNNFDQKITDCFQSYEEPLERLAPVQVRTQDDIMHNSQWVSFSQKLMLIVFSNDAHVKLAIFIFDLTLNPVNTCLLNVWHTQVSGIVFVLF